VAAPVDIQAKCAFVFSPAENIINKPARSFVPKKKGKRPVMSGLVEIIMQRAGGRRDSALCNKRTPILLARNRAPSTKDYLFLIKLPLSIVLLLVEPLEMLPSAPG
jgi:hypothetical protein